MRESIESDIMDAQQQRDAIVGMQRDMHHVLKAVEEIRRDMATQKDLELLATKAEVAALTLNLESHKRETSKEIEDLEKKIIENSPGAVWRTATGIALGFSTIAAAIVFLIKWAKGLP